MEIIKAIVDEETREIVPPRKFERKVVNGEIKHWYEDGTWQEVYRWRTPEKHFDVDDEESIKDFIRNDLDDSNGTVYPGDIAPGMYDVYWIGGRPRREGHFRGVVEW